MLGLPALGSQVFDLQADVFERVARVLGLAEPIRWVP
jgi:hypothetical protein